LLGDWALCAGWDGRSTIDGFATRLHWIEIAMVVLLSLGEALLLRRFALGTMVGWITIRLFVLWFYLPLRSQSRLVPVAAILIPLGVAFSEIVPFSVGCLAAAVWILEKSQRNATVQWCWDSLSFDELSRPTAARSLNSKGTKLLFPWYGTKPETHDPRPTLPDALWTASVVAAWAFCCAMHVVRIPPGELQDRLSALPWFLAAFPIGAVTIWRLSWFSLAKWYPHPGIISRIAHRRLIVWSYDRALFSHVLPFGIAGASLLLNLSFPLQITVSIWLYCFLILRLGPNPAEWELTADATLLNAEAQRGGRQNIRKRQVQRK